MVYTNKYLFFLKKYKYFLQCFDYSCILCSNMVKTNIITCYGAAPSAFNACTRLASFSTITLILMPSYPMQNQPSPDLCSWKRSSLQPGASRSKRKTKIFGNFAQSVDSLSFLFMREHFSFLLEWNLPQLNLFTNGLTILFSVVGMISIILESGRDEAGSRYAQVWGSMF